MEAGAIIIKKLGFGRSVFTCPRSPGKGQRVRAELWLKCFCFFSLIAWAYRQRETIKDVINMKPSPSEHLIICVRFVRGKVQRTQNQDELTQAMA